MILQVDQEKLLTFTRSSMLYLCVSVHACILCVNVVQAINLEHYFSIQRELFCEFICSRRKVSF